MLFKKLIIIIIIVSLILSNSVSVYIIFNQIKTYHKKCIKEAIKNETINEVVEVISFSKKDLKAGNYDIIFIEEYEFRFNGKMYDIISKWETEDTVFYKCINDSKEEQLEKSFVKYVVNNSKRQDIPLPIKNLLTFLNIDYFFNSLKLNIDKIQTCSIKTYPESFQIENLVEVPDPPPRNKIA